LLLLLAHGADLEGQLLLMPFDVICVMRERTSLSREIIERLPQLKFIASNARRNASIDMAAAEERGIRVTGTGYRSTPTIEMTWALILASARHIVREAIQCAGAAGRRRSDGNSGAGSWASLGLAISGRRLLASALP
jgi:lactate dehydrogenase-like 2-hydroxyacid dehydrogenase